MVMNDILANVTTDAGGYILPNPDPFYSASLDINAEKEKTTNAEITPKYKTRNLIIKFNVPDSIRIQADTTINSINATLSNVAKSFEIKTETVINSGLSAFTIPARIGQDSCICNYFGFIGNEQTFDIEMLLNYNFKRLISVDVSNLLNDFNTDKAKSKTVTIDWGMIKDQWYNIVPQ